MKKIIVISLLVLSAPMVAVAHSGHPDSVASASEAIHYLSPVHSIPFLAVLTITFLTVKRAVRSMQVSRQQHIESVLDK